MFTVDVDSTDDLERASLANCVTLTLGTVVRDVRGSEVHALTTAADLARIRRSGRWELLHNT